MRETAGSAAAPAARCRNRRPGSWRLTPRASVLVDLDRLHHTQLLVVHHVAMHHENAGVVEEARADDGAAARGRPRHDHRIAPRPISLRLTADLATWNGLVWMWNIWSSCR